MKNNYGFYGHWATEMVMKGIMDAQLKSAKERLEELEAAPSIVIYIKDNAVIAQNQKTGRTGVAKCSPEDTFDFFVGAKLALERLSEKEEKYKHEFKVGDRVVGNDRASKYYLVTKQGWIGNVKTVFPDGNGDIVVESVDGKHVFEVKADYFDLANDRLAPGDKVTVCNSSCAITEDRLKKLMSLTSNMEYIARYDFRAQVRNLYEYQRAGSVLNVLAASKEMALISCGPDAPTYLVGVKGLTRIQKS